MYSERVGLVLVPARKEESVNFIQKRGFSLAVLRSNVSDAILVAKCRQNGGLDLGVHERTSNEPSHVDMFRGELCHNSEKLTDPLLIRNVTEKPNFSQSRLRGTA